MSIKVYMLKFKLESGRQCPLEVAIPYPGTACIGMLPGESSLCLEMFLTGSALLRH